MLAIIDIVLLLSLAGFVFYGLFFGLIRSVGNIAGLLIGAYGASRVYLIIFNWIANFGWGHDNLLKVISFIVCFTVISRVVSLVFIVIDKFYSVLTIIPFLKTINRLAGAILGLVEGSFVLGLFLYIIARYTPASSAPAEMLASSKLAPFLLNFGNALVPLLPELVQHLKSII
jgi:uncharacterized membrane protein required for colicin V production